MSKLEFKEGQTYICTQSDNPWWTVGKEYTVVLNNVGIPALSDDEGEEWTSRDSISYYNQFKLKEKTVDLNKLTTAQLKEYLSLLEDKEKAEYLMNEFIERMSK